MNLKFLAISDTHLGEDTSLLCFNRGRQELWRVLREVFGQGKRFDVDEVILMGDIADRTLSSSAQIITQTNAFVRMLGSTANIGKCVYIPGNHDHTLWTDYIKRRYGLEHKVTKPDGELIVKVTEGNVVGNLTDAKDLLSIFFGYEFGSSWRGILKRDDEFIFSIANPIYAREFNNRSYVFTHGTHFRFDVSTPKWLKKIADHSMLDSLLAGYDIDVDDYDIRDAETIEQLEDAVHEFVDTLWPSPRNNPNPQADRLWFFLTAISGKLSRKRNVPDESKLFKWEALDKVSKKRVKRLVANNKFKDKSLEYWEMYFKKQMYYYLKKHSIPTNNLTFVYGDTHKGGWGEQNTNGKNIRFYNTGGWVTHNSNEHPACHIFAVDEEGQEYLLDVSMKGVTLFGDPLLEIASKDAESRYSFLGKTVSKILDLLIPD